MKKNKISFIYFLGPEGSGKSTLIALLSQWLENMGIKVANVEIRVDHLFVYCLKIILNRIGVSPISITKRGLKKAKTKEVVLSDILQDREILSRLQPLFLILDMMSILVLTLLKVYIPIILGYTIIAERFIVDSIASYTPINEQINKKEKNNGFISKMLLFLLRFIPNPHLIINLETSYNILEKRYAIRKSNVEPREWIDHQKIISSKICRIMQLNVIHICTDNKTIYETFKELLKNRILLDQ